MSRICLSCSLSNHSARPNLVSLIIDWAHLHFIVIQSPQLYISTHFTPVIVRSRTHYVDSTPSTIQAEYLSDNTPIDLHLLCLLHVFSSPTRLSVSVVSVLLSIPPSHQHVISVDKRISTLTSLPIFNAILRSHPLTSSLHCTTM